MTGTHVSASLSACAFMRRHVCTCVCMRLNVHLSLLPNTEVTALSLRGPVAPGRAPLDTAGPLPPPPSLLLLFERLSLCPSWSAEGLGG
eukprot:1308270-Rhodomonas_salina.1